MPSERREDPPALDESSEYAAVTLGSVWGIASLLLFVCAISTRQLVRFLPPHQQGWNLLPPVAVLAVPPLALIGLVLGLVGLRRSRRRTLALLGAALNGVVLLLAIALLVGFWWVRLR